MQYMEQALALAKQASGRTSPNPLVGAVVVKEGVIVGRGYHQQAGGPHAEVFALKEAGKSAENAELYVTLEPCAHYGRTPPCTKKIIEAKIKKVYLAMVDPNPLVAGQGVKQLEEAGIAVEIGLLAAEAKRLNEVFLKYITTKKPFVTLKVGMTLDGKIATKSGESRWITNDTSRQYVHRLRDQMDGIMVGIGTVLADDPELTTRLTDRTGKNPLRIIVDVQAKTPLQAKVCQVDAGKRTIIAVGQEADQKKIGAFRQIGVEVLEIKTEKGRMDLPTLMTELGKKQITSILLEGGSTLNGAMLEQKLIDKVCFFYAPKIFGGQMAPSAIGGEGVARIDEAIALRDCQVSMLDGDILLTAYPVWEGF